MSDESPKPVKMNPEFVRAALSDCSVTERAAARAKECSAKAQADAEKVIANESPTPETEEFDYDIWRVIPPWFPCIAKDKTGEWFAYYETPSIRQKDDYEYWSSYVGNEMFIPDQFVPKGFKGDWKDSLRKRPVSPNKTNNWQPISTLPHEENTIVDLYGQSREYGATFPPERHPNCCYMKSNGEMKWVNAQNHPVVNITHWMPIPSAPNSTPA